MTAHDLVELVGHLAWPLVVLLGLWLVRREIRKETLSDIPEELLDKIIAGFASEGARVEKLRQPDGKWTVVAVFDPDAQRRPQVKGAYRS